MALHFIIGGSGSGKSRKLQEIMIEKSMEDMKRQHIIMVPDQFTMQTQKEVVERHPSKGILNIDVQSFGRLYHRLSGELGNGGEAVLDDTGKNLILRHLAEEMKDELPTIGSSLNKNGYIHEVKSVISEFMEYGLSAKEVEALDEKCTGRRFLGGKLKDIARLYEAFETYLGDRFITREGRLDKLAAMIPHSGLLKGAVMGFDGFTGFTPVQYNVIRQLLEVCSDVYVNLIMPADEFEQYRLGAGEHRLFALSFKTFGALNQLAHDAGVKKGEDIYCDGSEGYRYSERPALSFIDRNIFRSGNRSYDGDCENELSLKEAADPAAELEEVFLRIREETYGRGRALRDIAVITADLERYAPYVNVLSEKYGVPVFMDRNLRADRNPLTEFIRGALNCRVRSFDHRSVMQLLKCGLAGVDEAAVDEFDNYLLATGIRGQSAYGRIFVRRTAAMGDDSEAMDRINATREAVCRILKPVMKTGERCSALEISQAVRQLCDENGLEEKMQAYAEKLAAEGHAPEARECEAVYDGICGLLLQIESFIGTEVMGIREFLEIFDAGLSELKTGVLPLDADRVVIGDMERTRLKPVKLLFFVGLNDGIIPMNGGSGGIISDLEREYLEDLGCVLSPTARQKMLMQRLYIYHALTRPEEGLILSYSKMDSKKESIRISYLVSVIRKMFPKLVTSEACKDALKRKLAMGIVPGEETAGYLREYAGGVIKSGDEGVLAALLELGGDEGTDKWRLMDAAFYRYDPAKLSRDETVGLYGKILRNSVSRVEKFAGCAYQHFLRYGMGLKERELAVIGAPDLGNLYHRAMELFGRKLGDEDWAGISEESADQMLDEVIKEAASEFGVSRLYEDARGAYILKRMKRILKRNVMSCAYQLGKGKFRPAAYEKEFSKDCLYDGEVSVKLKGKIDRLDTFSEGSNLYVKVVDYKSGARAPEADKIYAGTQLQLPVYLEQAVEGLAKERADMHVIPAAVFYYHIKDPIIKLGSPDEDEELERKKQMRPVGIISSAQEVVSGLDGSFDTESDVVRIKKKKDGGFTKSADVCGEDELRALCRFAGKKTGELAGRIMDGEIGASPLGADTCIYCAFRESCGFDKKLKGCVVRKLPDKDESWKKIMEEGGMADE